MKKILIVSAALLLSLLTFTRCNHENGEDNGGGNGNTNNPCAVVDVDGNCYDTVHIGNQVWMKSNLRTTHFRDGSAIPLGSSTNTAGPWYFQPSTADAPGYNSETYGLYYSEKVVHDTRGLCPAGWHVPTLADWNEMEKYVCTHYENYFNFFHNYGQEFYEEFEDDMEGELYDWYDDNDPYYFIKNSWDLPIAKAFTSKTGWSSEFEFDEDFYESFLSPANHPEYNNSTGFSAYPVGYNVCGSNLVSGNGVFTSLWTSTKADEFFYENEEKSIDSCSVFCSLRGGDPYVLYHYDNNYFGCSVRCVKD